MISHHRYIFHFVLKDRLERLAFAVKGALESAKKSKEYKIAEANLQKKAYELQLYYELAVGS